ncbi:MAG TPA: response regulator, partial [Hyphomicrobiaceae bacterium]|nr:response regulator [Hyphomicrobiaceae bacterium]
MPISKIGSGGEILAQRNEAVMAKRGLPVLSDIIIIEDETFDANRLEATLHLVLGRSAKIRRAQTLGTAIDCVLATKPDIVFLDDYLKPSDTAMQTIPFLRRAGYDGPIIVISGEIDRARRVELRAAGAVDALHKDDLDSAKLSEALSRAFKSTGEKDKPAA